MVKIHHLKAKSACGLPWTCDRCGKVYATSSALKGHTDMVHKGMKRPTATCTICNKTVSSEKYLPIHVKHVHSGVKELKCDICGRSFARRYTLVTHMRTHTKEKPFKCDFCPYICAQPISLKTHRKRCFSSRVKIMEV